jgi:hypothetical protein
MTIAVSIKVNDGLVLAADSASTLIDNQGSVVTVHNNANKIVNLCKGLPLAVMTWGAGSIGSASITTLLKDLRRRFAGDSEPHRNDWALDPNNYTVEHVANRIREFMLDEHYEPAFGQLPLKPVLGLSIAGYSSHQLLPEVWHIHFNQTNCDPPICISPSLPGNSGIAWDGDPEAISRLLRGFSEGLPQTLVDQGMDPVQVTTNLEASAMRLQAQVLWDPMPIQDTIDLAEWLVHTTVMYSRFTPGAATVGGPIEIAAITKHEGFKWVKRKHYFDTKINATRGGSHEEGWIRNGDR